MKNYFFTMLYLLFILESCKKKQEDAIPVAAANTNTATITYYMKASINNIAYVWNDGVDSNFANYSRTVSSVAGFDTLIDYYAEVSNPFGNHAYLTLSFGSVDCPSGSDVDKIQHYFMAENDTLGVSPDSKPTYNITYTENGIDYSVSGWNASNAIQISEVTDLGIIEQDHFSNGKFRVVKVKGKITNAVLTHGTTSKTLTACDFVLKFVSYVAQQ